MQATRLARAMVTRYGMSEVLGKVSVNYEDMGQSLSSETRAQVESEVSTPAGDSFGMHGASSCDEALLGQHCIRVASEGGRIQSTGECRPVNTARPHADCGLKQDGTERM